MYGDILSHLCDILVNKAKRAQPLKKNLERRHRNIGITT